MKSTFVDQKLKIHIRLSLPLKTSQPRRRASCRALPTPPMNLLKSIDYSVLQQCMHCGMCLPTCPTYVETKKEHNSPRGRISLMRS
eukprot:gene5944-7390_t